MLAAVADLCAGVASHANETTIGAYVIEEQIGSGSMGKVYRARHQRLGRHVALKVLREELLGDQNLIERFLQEGRAVNQINHEHIVEVHDYVEERDPACVYCVMEFLQGQTLAQRIAQRPSTIESIRSMARQLASALGASHLAGVVHRDLKPENVFLVSREGRDDWVKVLDFGIAKCVQPLGPERMVHTAQGTVLGTPLYMAPEQVAGLEVGPHTDIYALGTILYELIAGRPPFDHAPFGQLAADIITRPPPPLPSHTASGEPVPADLAALIRVCLAKRPEDRPANMAVVEAAAVQAPLLLTRLHRQRRGPWGVAALVAVALGLTVGFVRQPGPWVIPLPPPSIRAGPPVDLVTLWVETEPPGALVSRVDSGEPLGRTPMEVKLARAATTLPLRIELAGYAPLEREVSNELNQRLELTLLSLRKTAARPAEGRVTDGVLDPY